MELLPFVARNSRHVGGSNIFIHVLQDVIESKILHEKNLTVFREFASKKS